MRIGLRAQMRVIEMIRILVSPEEAEIAVRPGINVRLLTAAGEHEIGHFHILQQSKAPRAAILGLVIRNARTAQGVVALRPDLDDLPDRLFLRIRVGGFPTRKPVLEVFFQNERKFWLVAEAKSRDGEQDDNREPSAVRLHGFFCSKLAANMAAVNVEK